MLSLDPQKGDKTQNGHFPSKSALYLNKVCYKVSFSWILSETMYDIHWPIYPCKNGSWGTSASTYKFVRNWPTAFKNADF